MDRLVQPAKGYTRKFKMTHTLTLDELTHLLPENNYLQQWHKVLVELLPQYEQFISNFNHIRNKQNILTNINNTLLEIKDQIEIIKSSLDNINIPQRGGQIRKKIIKLFIQLAQIIQ